MSKDIYSQHQWYNDAITVRKMMLDGNGALCPSCGTPFDSGKHRKLIDTCGHEICYMCINSDHCPLCIYSASQMYAGIRQSSESRFSRPRLKTNGHFTTYMQARDESKFSPERPPPPLGIGPLKTSSFLPPRGYPLSSPQLPRARVQRKSKWPNPLLSESQGAFSDDEVQSFHPKSKNQDLYTRLGLLLGDRMHLSNAKNRSIHHHSSQASYASISSLASSEANTTNTSPLSTLTDSSEIDPASNISSFRTPSREQSSDSVVSLMSTSTGGHSSSSSPMGTIFQRHTPGRSSDSFIHLSRRNVARSHNSDDSALHLTELGKKSHLTKVLNRSLKPLYFEVPQCDNDPVFVGRHWLFKEIEQEILTDSKSKKSIVIVGGPGSGKTAIAMQIAEHSSFKFKREDAIYQDIQSLDGSDYAMSNSSGSDSGMYQSITALHVGTIRSLGNRLIAYHFCQADNNITCLVPEFVHSIAAHLCRAPQLVAYRDLVSRDQRLLELLSMPSCISDASTAFVHGVLEPLHMLRCQNKIPNTTCLMVVDGLNEAEFHRPDYGDTIATFLVKHIQAFPSWLKLIVTMRTSFSDIVKTLPSRVISLDKVSAHENLHKDISSYILQRISSSPAIRANITVNNSKVEGSSNSRFAAHLAALSKGCMLYVRLTLDLIEKGYLVVKSSSYRVLPVSLSEVYMLNFNLRFTTSKAYDRVTPLLQTCLATLYPLTLQELFMTVNARYLTQQVTWEDFMKRLDTLMAGPFLVTRQDGTVMFAHPSMREWLLRRDEHENGKFLCDVRAGHSAIAFRMSRSEQKLNSEEIIELGHHILKAHIYRSVGKDDLPVHPRELQAYWVNLGSSAIESALSSLRNIYSPNVKVSRLLLLSGASPQLVMRSLGNTPLLALAAYYGFSDMVSLLVEFGADINAVSDTGMGALAVSCQQGFIDIARLLLAKGAKINQVDNEGNFPAVHAAFNGHLDVLVHLFQCDWPLEMESNLGLDQAAQRCLVAAAEKGHASVCEFLLDMSEVNVNAIDNLSGHTALTAASQAGHIKVCETLLRRKALVSVPNKQKETPLACAAAEGHWEVAERLLLHGAVLEQVDSLGRTPLMLSGMNGHPVLELLLSKGASTEVCDNDGLSALCWASLKGHYQTVQCLLHHGANINHTDRSGRTPLDFAAYNGDSEVVQLLLDSGAVLEHVDLTGMRPLDRAIACKNTAAVMCFLHKGAKLGSQTWSVAEGNQEILLLLLTKLLEDATLLYKRTQLKDAAHRYQYALKKFPGEVNLIHDRQFQQVKYQLYLGLSRCRRKMKEPLQALQAAERAVLLKPKSYEGFYARGRAHEELGNHQCALADITEAIKLAPQNMETRKVLLRLKDEISSSASSDRSLSCDNTDNNMDSICNGHHKTSVNVSSTETIDQLCNLTLDIVADLTQMNEKLLDSGCESNQ